MTAVLKIAGLQKSYGGLPVLFDVELEVADGETLSIIGPNGAGKTTLFKVLTGEVLANSGRITYRGTDVTFLPPEVRVRLGFGRTFQIARILPANTVLENLVVAVEARLRNRGETIGGWLDVLPSRRVLDEARNNADAVGLLAKSDVEARYLSYGDKKRLEIAAMLCLKPSILILDEPTAGMSPSERMRTVELIQKIKHENALTVMLTEHDMDVVFGLSDRVLVLNFGRIVACDTPANIQNHPEVRAVYLGTEAH